MRRAFDSSEIMTINPPQSQAQSQVSLDPASPVRVSERVVGILSDRIRSGMYGAGDLLPTERTLAADLGVHRRSVRAAIDHLVQDGLVSRRPNCRPTVGGAASRASASGSRLVTPLSSDAARLPATPRLSAANLIALIMWHGGPLEHTVTSQQRIFLGMNQSLMKIGYHAVFLDLGGEIGSEAENAAREAQHLRYIQEQGFGGALFYPYAYRHNRDLVRKVSRTVPLVLLDRKIHGVDLDFVGIKNQEAQSEMTRHLIAQGHRRIAHLTRSEPIHSVQDRVQGYLDTMRGENFPDANGFEMTEMILHLPPYKDERAWRAVDAVFRLPEEQRPTAVCCSSDYLAANLAERLGHLGLSVPKDVALTGFDSIVPDLPGGMGLTTMAQPFEEIGATAVELLMRRIQDREAGTVSVELPARLIVRESSAS